MALPLPGSEASGPLVVLPQIATLIPQIPLEQPTVIIEEAALSVAFTPAQQAVSVFADIDLARVSTARSKSLKGKAPPTEPQPYSQKELKEIARRLGIRTGQSKPDLVAAIRQKMGA